jgi:hypothetical protein
VENLEELPSLVSRYLPLSRFKETKILALFFIKRSSLLFWV